MTTELNLEYVSLEKTENLHIMYLQRKRLMIIVIHLHIFTFK